MSHTVMIVDDDPRHRKLYSDILEKSGFKVLCSPSSEDAMNLMDKTPLSMIVSDVKMPGMDGISFLKKIRENSFETPFLLVTAYPDIKDAVKALKLGAVDYLEKPVDLDELISAVSDTLNADSANGVNSKAPEEKISGIIAESPIMKSILKDARRVAESDVTVLITGESGTGKEVLARFIHECSLRKNKPFVAVNCAAVSANILPSELFGHEKGAFTGAHAKKKGLFREAEKGTLFLDEIGDMPLKLQPALLRAIETGRIMPVGSGRESSVDFRLIASTNRNLKSDVARGEFREDLFYRLNVIAFEIPPLRERKEDIMPLVKLFLSEKKGTRLSPSASSLIMGHSWPGNVRELQNALKRASLLSGTGIILPEHLPEAVREKSSPLFSPDDPAVKTMEQAGMEAIKSALEKTGGNRTKAAELLGISRRSLTYKLKTLDDI